MVIELKKPLFFVEKSKMPNYFNGKADNELGIHYYFNSKSWMNIEIFWKAQINWDIYMYVLFEQEIGNPFHCR